MSESAPPLWYSLMPKSAPPLWYSFIPESAPPLCYSRMSESAINDFNMSANETARSEGTGGDIVIC